MGTAAALSVKVSANIGDFEKQIASLETSLSKAGSSMSSMGAKLTTGLTLPLVGAAAALVGIGMKFDQASDSIRAATGATGTQLESLNKSFKTVLGNVPNSVDQVATAIGDLSVRTGRSGTDLESLATQMLNLSRLTGSEIAPLIQSTTRLFGDWSVATENQAGTLDYLFRTSQATGIGVGQLSDLVVQFGAPLRALGFDFETAAAMMGKWEKEGVNLETVLAGMKMGLKNFAKAGEDPAETLGRVIGAIKNAGSAAKENSIAFQVFGQRAGIDMARAIKEGRLDLDQLVASLRNGKETINRAAADTLSLSDRMQLLGNRVMLAAEPLATLFVGALEKLIIRAQPFIDMLVEIGTWFANLPTPIQEGAIAIAGFAAVLGPIEYLVGNVAMTISALIGVFRLLGVGGAIQGTTEALQMFGLASEGAMAVAGPIAALAAYAAAFVAFGIEVRNAIKDIGAWQFAKEAAAGVFAGGLGGFGVALAGAQGGKGKDEQAWWDEQQRKEEASPAEAMLARLKSGLNLGGTTGSIANLLKGKGNKTAKLDEYDKFQKSMNDLADDIGVAADRHRSLNDQVALFGPRAAKAMEEAGKWGVTLKDSVTNVGFAELKKQLDKEAEQKTPGILKEQMDALDKSIDKSSKAWLKNADVRIKLEEATTARIEKINGDSLERRIAESTKPFTALRKELEPFASDYTEMMARISAEERNAADQATFEWEQHLNDVKNATNSYGNIFRTALSGIPGLIQQALTGGGGVGGAAKSALSGLGGALGGKLATGGLGNKLVSGLFNISSGLGSAIGSIMGPLGSAIGSLLGPLASKIGNALKGLFGMNTAGRDEITKFADTFGGFDKMHSELLKMGAAGEEMWVKLTQGTGRGNAEQAKKNIEDVQKAMEAYKAAVTDLVGGVNARAQNVTTQGDVNVVGAGAATALALQIQQGMSAAAAFQAIAPAVTALKDAFAAGNLEMTATAARLIGIGTILDTNKIQFDNLAASGTILSAMLQGNIKDLDLFRAVSADIGVQLQAVIDRGVPMSQVFALAQPQLQALWEAEQKWGFQVDANTQGLLDQAAAQGFVGAAMQSVNQQILNVLIDIRNVMLGLPVAAETAAAGMNDAFSKVRPPDFNFSTPEFGPNGQAPGEAPEGGGEVPEMGTGGIVRARPGGTLIRVAESGKDEFIGPVNRMGGGVTVNLNADVIVGEEEYIKRTITRGVIEAIRSNTANAFTGMQAALGMVR